MTSSAISIRNLRKKYGDTVAIKGIDIDIKDSGSNNCSAVKLNILEASKKGASTTSGQDFITPVKTIITSVKAVPNKDAK